MEHGLQEPALPSRVQQITKRPYLRPRLILRCRRRLLLRPILRLPLNRCCLRQGRAQVRIHRPLPTPSVRGNVLATTEFALTLNVRYSVTGKNGEQLAPPSEAVGTTSFFVSSDVTTDERQALPLATEDLATRLVSQISEGW